MEVYDAVWPWDSIEDDQGGMWLEFGADAGVDDGGAPRGQGWYPMVAAQADGRRASGFASVLVGRLWDIRQGSHNADISVCLSRVRPDEVIGYVRWNLWGVQVARGPDWPDWRSIVWRQKFTVRFPEAPSATRPTPPATFEDPPAPPWFDYGAVGYDAAWPWDAITDPTLREHLRERYRPR